MNYTVLCGIFLFYFCYFSFIPLSRFPIVEYLYSIGINNRQANYQLHAHNFLRPDYSHAHFNFTLCSISSVHYTNSIRNCLMMSNVSNRHSANNISRQLFIQFSVSISAKTQNFENGFQIRDHRKSKSIYIHIMSSLISLLSKSMPGIKNISKKVF